MRTTILILLSVFQSIILFARTEIENKISLGGTTSYLTCEVAGQEISCTPGDFNYICDVSNLNGYCPTLSGPNTNPTGPTPLCSTGGIPDNTLWISFIASSSNLDMDITTMDCGFAGGLQWGIVSDCNFTSVICYNECDFTNTRSIVTDQLVAGQKYWLWFDACNGAPCQLEITVNDGGGSYDLPEINTSKCEGCLDSSQSSQGTYDVCTSSSGISFCIDNTNNDYDQFISEYFWNIDEIIDGIPSNLDKNGNLGLTEENCISIDFDLESYPIGMYEVCMTYVGSCCDSEGPFCMTVNITEANSCPSDTISNPTFIFPECFSGEDPIYSLAQVEGLTFSMLDGYASGPSPLCSNGGGVSYNTSWISFIAGDDAEDFDLEIMLSNCDSTIMNPGVTWGIVSDCDMTEVICDGNCTNSNIFSIVTDALIPGQQYWLWIDGCNGTYCDFQLNFNSGLNPSSECDSCYDCTQSMYPETDPQGNINFSCLNVNLSGSTYETEISACGFNLIPTTWIQIYTDDLAAQIYINASTSGGSWSPVFALFEGDCGNLSPIHTVASPHCSSDWPALGQINQPAPSSGSYWLAIGADGNLDDIMNFPELEICVATTVTLFSCLGEIGGQCDDLSDWVLMDSTNPDQALGELVDQSSDAIPHLCPGETIELCGSLIYDTTDTGADWLSGIVPFFGNGWNTDSFDASASEMTGNGMSAVWYDDMDTLAPILQEDVSTLCMYTDSYGNLQLCNALCQTCPCSPGIQAGTPLPGGWFWVSNGGNAGCENDGSPGEGWGIGTTIVNIDFCFEITVRDDFASNSDCAQANLTIGFQTFSDGVAGCWEDPVGECLLDESQILRFNINCDESIYYLDNDNDTFGDPSQFISACYPPAGYVSNAEDCNDSDDTIYPDAMELCDGLDNDCDGLIDNDLDFNTYYIDVDNDGYGSNDMTVTDCIAPAGYVDNADDCNDTDPSINPATTEICDGLDNNCDGVIDEGLTNIYYSDEDMDGYGDPDNIIEACDQPPGTAENDLDCDDSDTIINPDATEICDGIDNNCDGQIDEGFTTETYYLDSDLDGFGDPENQIVACSQPNGYVTNDLDCNDSDASINPDATEICDEIDNNCDGQIDEGFTYQDYWVDGDMDGYGDPLNTVNSCEQPPGTTTNGDDCDDMNSAINPSAEDIPNNGIDEDCDGMDAVSATHEIDGVSVNIFPNPTSGRLHIKVDGTLDLNVELINIEGKRILNQNHLDLDLSGLQNGIYLLRLKDAISRGYLIERIVLNR